MKKNFVYILLIVSIMSVFTGCKNKEPKGNEIMAEDNAVTLEDTLKENNSDDSINVNKDSNDSSNDNIETENKEVESKEIESKEIESKEIENKEIENKEIENKEIENKEKQNKEKQNKENLDKENKNKENQSKENENKQNVNKDKNNKENEKKDNVNIDNKNKEDLNNKKDNSKNENKENKNKEKDISKKENNKKENNKDKNKEKDNNENKNKDDNKDQSTTDIDLLTLIDKIYGIKDPGLRLVNASVDLSNSDSVKYNTGLSDISKIKEAVVSEPMMGSQAYSLVLVKLEDSKDAESIAKEMLNGINPRKWICVEADDLQVVSHDDVIMLVMVSSSFEEKVTSQQIVDAFKKVCDGELDIKLKK